MHHLHVRLHISRRPEPKKDAEARRTWPVRLFQGPRRAIGRYLRAQAKPEEAGFNRKRSLVTERVCLHTANALRVMTADIVRAQQIAVTIDILNSRPQPVAA